MLQNNDTSVKQIKDSSTVACGAVSLGYWLLAFKYSGGQRNYSPLQQQETPTQQQSDLNSLNL